MNGMNNVNMADITNIKDQVSYRLLNKISETNYSTLYQAVVSNSSGNEDELLYAIKEIDKKDSSFLSLENEKKMTHIIENHSKCSVVIPVFTVISPKCSDKEYAIMQYKGTGIFLNQLITELEQKWGKGKIPFDCQLTIISKILYTLNELHNCLKETDAEEGITGVLHMDLHPGNIFFESADVSKQQFGMVKFIDFQNALILNEQKKSHKQTAIRKNDFISITTGFSAPEQEKIEKTMFTPAADLYAVAAIAARMATGKVVEDDYMTYQDIVEDMDFSEIESVFRYMLKNFLDCGLDFNPLYRYQTAEEMLEEVNRLQECLKAYEEENYYNFFAKAYEMLVPQSQIYAESMKMDEKNFCDSVELLANVLVQSNINAPKSYYIFEALWKLNPKHDNISLINSGIAVSNHMGNSIRAKELWKELQSMKNTMPIMDYIEVVNRVAVIYADTYEYEEQYQLLDKNIKSLEKIKETYHCAAEIQGLSAEESIAIKALGKTYSAMGCCLTLLKRGEPMQYFNKALKEFGDDSGNKEITYSHILHYAVQQNDEALFRMYAKEYLGKADSISACLKQVRSSLNSDCNLFTLWAFLKGVNQFYTAYIDEDFKKQLIDIFETGALEIYNTLCLPMVYKYIAKLLYAANGNIVDENVIELFEKSLLCQEDARINSREPLSILMCMNYATMETYNEIIGNEEANQELREAFLQHAQESGWKSLAEKLKGNEPLSKLFMFEYC